MDLYMSSLMSKPHQLINFCILFLFSSYGSVSTPIVTFTVEKLSHIWIELVIQYFFPDKCCKQENKRTFM